MRLPIGQSNKRAASWQASARQTQHLVTKTSCADKVLPSGSFADKNGAIVIKPSERNDFSQPETNAATQAWRGCFCFIANRTKG